ncbi:MAG: flagellar hook-associated protein FlgK [Peptostreptococcaceae bacterium]|nr:flagellar hook-associated protein FlgK [Peptostreptococcaceae bacterium]
MRSTFGSFGAATSGLFAAQRALDVVGHNLSNVNTPGYTRQRLNQTNARPMNIPGGKGPIGLGVEMVSITQIRNEFLDIQYRKESETLGMWEERTTYLTQIESTFNEPSDKSIASAMNKFYASMHEVAKSAADPTARKVMVQNAVALSENLNFMAGRFEKLIEDLNSEVEATVRQINTYAQQISTLNRQIYEVEVDGSHANDLRDKRNLALDQLSKLVNIQVVHVPDHASDGKYMKMNVLINGTGLVLHDYVNEIALEKNQEHPLTLDGKRANPPRDDLSTLRVTNLKWSTGSYINPNALGGTLGGQIDMRDNFDGDEKGIPYYLRMINEFANTFATAFNVIHQGGKDLNGGNGKKFFAPDGNEGSAQRITAKNIRVNSRILNSPSLVAASLHSTPQAADESGIDNAKNIDRLLRIREGKVWDEGSSTWKDFVLKLDYGASGTVTLGEGKPDDVMKSLIGVLGVDGAEAKRKTKNQEMITESVNGYRKSVSGVSQDEEMSNMIKYQHAYNASARMITTIDEMIDVLINRMGRVGL